MHEGITLSSPGERNQVKFIGSTDEEIFFSHS